ncbi:MAG: DUF2029 domain-containing protein [Fidelibacterota bacterium]|nr:MAG: DUF2029 domain-containing protein [Candidatus Neomarinimicrobiota bacterium]
MAKKKPKSKPQPMKAGPLQSLFAGRYAVRLHLLAFGLGAAVYGIWSVLLGQDNNWDLRNYHYYNPFALLNGRLGFDYAPAQIQSFLNPLQDLPFYFLVNVLPPMGVGFVMGALHGLNFGLIFAIAWVLLPGRTPALRLGLALLCAAVGMYSPITLAELGATENDLFTGLFAMAALLVVIRSLTGERIPGLKTRPAQLLVAGLIMGIGCGLKLTAVPYALGLLLASLVIGEDWRQRLTTVGWLVAGLVLGFLLSGGFWMITMWSHYRSPLFPFYNQWFQSPYYDLRNFGDARFMPRSVLEWLFQPFYFFTSNQFTYHSNDFRDIRYAIIYVLLGAFLVLRLIRGKTTPGQPQGEQHLLGPGRLTSAELVLLTFFISSYVIWELQFSVIRYIPPLEHLAPLMIMILVFRIFSAREIRAGALGVLFLIGVLIVRPPGFQRLPWSNKFFDTQAPPLEQPDQTVVLIASDRPWSYLIPAFPSGVRFVRVGGNFTRPHRPTRMVAEMRELIDNHQGPLYLLSRMERLREDAQLLQAYNVALLRLQPKPVGSRHEPRGLVLWPAVRMEN